jgi:hypothetical protein
LHIACVDVELLVVGLNANFEGLQPNISTPPTFVASISSATPRPLSGRHIHRANVAAECSSDLDESESLIIGTVEAFHQSSVISGP